MRLSIDTTAHWVGAFNLRPRLRNYYFRAIILPLSITKSPCKQPIKNYVPG